MTLKQIVPKSIWSRDRMPLRATFMPVSSQVSRLAASSCVSLGLTPPPEIHQLLSRQCTHRNLPAWLRQITREQRAMGSSRLCDDIQLKSIIFSHLVQMGATCEALCESTVDAGELDQIFRNRVTGRLLGLSPQERQQYWESIRMKLRQGQPNQFFPDTTREECFIYFPHKYFYEGRVKDKVPHGKGRLQVMGSGLAVEGWFRQGRVEGECVAVGEGVRVEGRWQGGLPHQVRIKGENRQYFIQFDLPSLSRGKIIFPNGSTYRGEFRFDFEEKQHVAEGQGIFTYLNGNTLTGVFYNGFLEGEGVFECKALAYIYRGYFKRGRFDGTGTLEMKDKGELRIEWRANLPHGRGEFTTNGSSVQIHYENGVRKTQVSNIFEDTII